MRLVQIATHIKGYRVYAGKELKRYAPDKNQATPARYHMSDYIFNLNISLSYGSAIGTFIHTWSESGSRRWIV